MGMTKELDWSRHEGLRCVIEQYYNHVKDDQINLPMYDTFVTEVRNDWESAGYDMTNPEDIYKLWGMLDLVIGATQVLAADECETPDEMYAVATVVGTFGNMTGMFLREMSRYVPGVPPVHTHDKE